MTNSQIIITFLVFALGTMFTRFITFFVFPPHSEPPKEVIFLGSVLPTAAIGLIVVFALKDTPILTAPYGIPEAIAIVVIVLLQKWQRKSILSIIVGTAVYMFLVQQVF